MQTDIRKISCINRDNDGYYVLNLDICKYVHGYSNDTKIFKAIKQQSKVDWEFIDIRHDILHLKTKFEFEPFEIDLSKLKLVRAI